MKCLWRIGIWEMGWYLYSRAFFYCVELFSFDSGYCGIHGSIQEDPWIYFDCVISCYKYRGGMIPDIGV